MKFIPMNGFISVEKPKSSINQTIDQLGLSIDDLKGFDFKPENEDPHCVVCVLQEFFFDPFDPLTTQFAKGTLLVVERHAVETIKFEGEEHTFVNVKSVVGELRNE